MSAYVIVISVLFFKQKSADELRISDWRSDVCSSDLSGFCGATIIDAKIAAAAMTTAIPRKIRIGRYCSRRSSMGTGTGERYAPGSRALTRARRGDGLRSADIRHRGRPRGSDGRSEEHTSELQSLMRISYAVFCLKKKTKDKTG